MTNLINKEFEHFDKEKYINFKIINISVDNNTITLQKHCQGKISIVNEFVYEDKFNNKYFNYGIADEIYLNDFQ